MKRKKSKKGFTLAELLIVMSIIAILTAISVPTFSLQLEGARKIADMSNAQAASALAYSEYMLFHTNEAEKGGAITYTFGTDDNLNLFIMSHSSGGKELDDDNNVTDGTEIKARSSKLSDVKLEVTVEDGKISENTWLGILGGH